MAKETEAHAKFRADVFSRYSISWIPNSDNVGEYIAATMNRVVTAKLNDGETATVIAATDKGMEGVHDKLGLYLKWDNHLRLNAPKLFWCIFLIDKFKWFQYNSNRDRDKRKQGDQAMNFTNTKFVISYNADSKKWELELLAEPASANDGCHADFVKTLIVGDYAESLDGDLFTHAFETYANHVKEDFDVRSMKINCALIEEELEFAGYNYSFEVDSVTMPDGTKTTAFNDVWVNN